MSEIVRGVGARRPATAGSCRRPTKTFPGNSIAVHGTGVASSPAIGIGGEAKRMTVAAAKGHGDGRRPKSALASRSRPFREGNEPSAVR